MASGITDSSLTYHLQNARAHGVTREEIAAIITHATMYVGWPKGWAVFRLAKEVWKEEEPALTEKDRYQSAIFFPVGEPNPYGEFFVGQSRKEKRKARMQQEMIEPDKSPLGRVSGSGVNGSRKV